MDYSNLWKDHWPRTRQRITDWWNNKGLVLNLTAPKDTPWADVPEPAVPADINARWLDPVYRAAKAQYRLSRTYFGGESLPIYEPLVGCGDLAAFLGSTFDFADQTVWFNPCILPGLPPDASPENHPPLRFDPKNALFRTEMAMLHEGVRLARSGESGAPGCGHFFVALPDLMENIDILASLRGIEDMLIDMTDRPDWVLQRIADINRAYFRAFDAFYEVVRGPLNDNAYCFQLWAPGKTAKLQCDASAMFSADMFAKFVLPALKEQAAWLDYAMYHLDGEQCFCHLDHLLAIDDIRVIEWTPQLWSQGQGGGKPMWYDLYRRILKAGKSVQAVFVEYDEVLPLLDAVGPDAMCIWVEAPTEEEARKLEEKVDKYR